MEHLPSFFVCLPEAQDGQLGHHEACQEGAQMAMCVCQWKYVAHIFAHIGLLLNGNMRCPFTTGNTNQSEVDNDVVAGLEESSNYIVRHSKIIVNSYLLTSTYLYAMYSWLAG